MRMNEIQNTNVSNKKSEECFVLESDLPTVDMLNDTNVTLEGNHIDNNISNAEESILKIHFKNESTFLELKDTITKCIKDALFYFQKSVLVCENQPNFTLTFNETTSEDEKLFVIDSDPSLTHAQTNIPQYSPCAVTVDQVNEELENDSSNKPTQNACFNCDGSHTLKDCPEPKDYSRIKQNRLKFSANTTNKLRYHVDVDQGYNQFVAGELSTDLREALGLRSKDLPIHIYRMRMLGYPPGWLEYAKVPNSGLSMFGTVGDKEPKDEDKEDKYNLNKILSFPGFNVNAPRGTRDEGFENRAPPMNPRQSKAVMIRSLKCKSKLYRRRKKLDETILTPVDMDINNDDDDMDINNDDISPPIPSATSPSLVTNSHNDDEIQPKSPLSDGEIDDSPNSPSLCALHDQKKLLLAALDDSSVSISGIISQPLINYSQDDSLIDDILALNETTFDGNLNNSTLNNTPSLDTTENRIMYTSKEKLFGTPVIESVSPFDSLPKGDKWSAGVSDVIEFENLPESTGNFEKLRAVIGNVRTKVKELEFLYEN